MSTIIKWEKLTCSWQIAGGQNRQAWERQIAGKPPLCVDTAKRPFIKQGSWSSTDTESAEVFILHFLAWRTTRNIFLLFTTKINLQGDIVMEGETISKYYSVYVLFIKACFQEKLFYQGITCWMNLYKRWTYLGVGKYPTHTISSLLCGIYLRCQGHKGTGEVQSPGSHVLCIKGLRLDFKIKEISTYIFLLHY